MTKFNVLEIKANYDAAKYGRRLASWRAPSTGPNAAIQPAARTVRDRARDSVRNDGIAAAIVRQWTSAIVGSGIGVRPSVDDSKLKAKLSSLWREFNEGADFYGIQHLDSLQASIISAVIRDGECFVQLIHATSPTDTPLELKILEADLCPLEHNSFAENGNVINAGIEYDEAGRKVAYHMHRFHPGEAQTLNNYGFDLVRIPADEILHIFHSERPGQQRGISWLAPVLTQLKNLSDYEDAVLERTKLQNLYTGFITRSAPVAGQENVDPLTGQIIGVADNGLPMVSLEPGAMIELAPGENVQFSAPPSTGADHADYIKTRLQAIAAGVGLPFISLSGDVENLSDRSLRVVVQDHRRQVEAYQYNLIINQFLKPVYKTWLHWSVMTGLLLPSEAKKAALCEFAPPRWKFIHPVQDVQSLKAEVDAGFRSRSSVIAELGNDPDQVDAERAADLQREESLNLITMADKKARADIALTWAQTDAARTAKITTAATDKAKQITQPATNAQALKIENAQLELALSESQIAKFNLEAAKFKLEDIKLEVEASKLGLEELRRG